jgi:hypothetical protein
MIVPLVVMAAALIVPAAAATRNPGTASLREAGALVQAPGPRSPEAPRDQAQSTYLRECMGQGAGASKRRAYCQCSFQQLRRRYTPQQYALLDDWIRSGPPELRRFAVVAWEPEFASCRPLLQTGVPAAAPQNQQPVPSK